MQAEFEALSDGGEARLRAGRPSFGPQLEALKAKVLAAATGAPTVIAQRYVVGRTLGHGASGVVFEAEDSDLQRKVAIKLIKSRTEEEVRRVVREARALAQLSHPNVVQVFEVGVREGVSGSAYVVMELVEGQTLREWFTDAPRPAHEVVATVLQAAHGLRAAHRVGIVHRDFKPDNVLVGSDGRVRVVDFGLARPAFSDTESTDPGALQRGYGELLTPMGQGVGTPAYMAPEGFVGEATEASDQYSLCVVLYEGLVGRRPQQSESIDEFIEHQRRVEVTVPRSASVPRRVATVIERGLQRDPHRRFADIGALIEALEHGHRRRPIALAAAVAVGCVGLALSGTADDAPQCVMGRAAWTDVGGYEDLADVIGAPLARYTEAWLEAERTMCVGSNGRLTAPQRACLDRRMQDAHALAELAPTLDHEDHAGVARALESLDPPAQCASDDSGEFAPPPSELADAVAVVQRKLARLRALNRTARDAAGLVLSAEVLQDSREVGFAPMHAEAANLAGRFSLLAAQYDDARAAYEECYFAARDASIDWWAAQCASSLTMVVGSYLEDPGQGRRWAEHAAAAFERAGFDPLERVNYIQGLLQIARGEGQHAEQERLARIGLRLAKADANVGAGSIEAMYGYIALAQYKQGDHEGALESFGQAADHYEQTIGYGSLPQAGQIDNMGAALRRLERPREALEKHLEALGIREQQMPPGSVEIAYSHGNVALAARDLGRTDEALEHATRAVTMLSEHYGPDHTEVAGAYRILGEVHQAMGAAGRADAIVAYNKALRVYADHDAEGIEELERIVAELKAEPTSVAPRG